MELVFETKSLVFWELVARQSGSQEETAELIVPDSFPDLERIVDSWAQILLRSKESRAGSVSISGVVQAGLLFLAEGEASPRRMECSIPFDWKLEQERLSKTCFAEYRGWVKHVDAHVLNSRKAMIRVNLCSEISAWEKTNLQIPMLAEQQADLQCKKRTYALPCIQEVAERNITLQEEVELPQGMPGVERLLDWSAQVRIHECKSIGTRIAFRGNLETEAFYETADGRLNRYSATTPVTQYVELDRQVEGMLPEVSLCITGRDLQTGEAGRKLYIQLNLLAQARVSAYEELELLEDLYSTKDQVTPSWVEFPVTVLLDQRILQQPVRQTISVSADQVERSRICWEQPQQRRQGDQILFTLPLRLKLLCRDAEGTLQSSEAQFGLDFSLAASEECTCFSWVQVQDVYVSAVAGGVELRCNVCLHVDSLAHQKLNCVNAAVCSEQEQEEKRPSVLIRRMRAGENLWSIAKSCAAPMQELLEVNHLQEDEVEEGFLLLIPLK